MQLSPDQVERFYAIWKPLLLFVNDRRQIESALLGARGEAPWDPQKIYPVRESLWADDSILDTFVAENPAHLSPEDLAIARSWHHRVAGTFCVFRHLKKHSVLIKDGPREVYAVLGLASTLEEILPFTPCYARVVLLPFEGQIVYDSLIAPYNVYLGPGIRRNLAEDYKDARERGAVITSLLPPEEPPGREEEQAEAQEVDARVLQAFRKHLFRTGLSPRVVERDAASVAAFADWLATRSEPRSLRDFGTREVGGYLASVRSEGRKEAEHKQGRIGLTRFLRFLRDTGRMDYHAAGDVLELLKG